FPTAIHTLSLHDALPIFFFNGFQATRTRTAPPTSLSFVNTAASLTGDYSALESAGCQSSGRAVSLIDPLTNQPFPNNFISPTIRSEEHTSELQSLAYLVC